MHKTSDFDQHERDGMLRAADDAGLDCCELVWLTNPARACFATAITRRSGARFCSSPRTTPCSTPVAASSGTKPTPECMFPRPVALRAASIERSVVVAQEVLALSKMNWNSTRFDGRLPCEPTNCPPGRRHHQAPSRKRVRRTDLRLLHVVSGNRSVRARHRVERETAAPRDRATSLGAWCAPSHLFGLPGGRRGATFPGRRPPNRALGI